MPIEVGHKFPDFALPDENGTIVKRSDFEGRRWVLFFYPKADTPGCTREACDFRDEISAFEKKKVEVIGVSKDTPEDQRKFKEKYQLPFPLLSDAGLTLINAAGVWKEKTLYGKKVMGTERTTVIIGPDGTIEKIFPQVNVDGHVEGVLGAL